MLPADNRSLDLRTIFDQVAAQYDAIRPDYPQPLIDTIVAQAGLTPDAAVLEIGCGSGQATLPFARQGFRITCIELGPALAARAATHLQPYPRVHVHVGAFEDWEAPPGTFDLVMSATAFHWIPPETGYPKAAALLKPGGTLALFSNEHPTPFAGFFADVQPVYQRAVPTRHDPASDPDLPERIARTAATIDATGLFAPVSVTSYPWSQVYTTQQYIQLLNTYSDHLSLPPAVRLELERGIADLIDRAYGGAIDKPYQAVLYLAKKC